MNFKQVSNTNRTAVYDITVTQKDLTKRYADALKALAAETEVEGFRKGKASTDLVEKQVGKERIYDKLIQDLLPEVYKEILEKDKLEPVIAPKVELKSAKEGEDWTLSMSIALQPKVALPDYKKIAKNVRGNAKKDDIWIPGKGNPTKEDKEQVEKREKYINELLKALLDQTKIEMSDIIIEQEINQRLTRLVDDVRKIGLTIDAYFESRGTSQEKVKEDFRKEILDTYKLEYALNEIGDAEKITIEKEEIDKLISGMPDEASRKEAQQNVYVYSMMLRKQKILDFLGNL